MKTLHKNLVCGIVAMSLVTIASVSAADDKASSASFVALSKVTQIELPAKAAQLVLKADAKHRQQTTIDVVKAALGLNPAAAPNIVASVAHSCPEMAAVAAGTAASLVPDQAAEIARVAASAAPKKSGQIVNAVCRVVPKFYKEIAEAVAEAAPDQGRQILMGLSSAMPMLETSLNKIVDAANGNNIPTVSTVLNEVQTSPVFLASTAPTTTSTTPTTTSTTPTTTSTTPTTTAPAPTTGSVVLAPPSYGPPYVNPPGTQVNLNPGSGTTVPTGGRNYASP